MKQKLYSFIQRGLFVKVLVAMLFAFAATGYAQTVDSKGTWGGIDWTLYTDGTFVVEPTKGDPVPASVWTYEVGEWREVVSYNATGGATAIGGWPYDRSKVKKLIIEEGVTKIGSFAAQSMTNLTGEIVIPWTVTYIGQEAFQNTPCTKFTFQKVPAGQSGQGLCIAPGALKNMAIEEIAFPEDRPVELHAWVLNGCAKLKYATFPATVTFAPQSHLEYMHNPEKVWNWDNRPFSNSNSGLLVVTFGSEEVKKRYQNLSYQGNDPFVAYNNFTFVGLIGFTSTVGSVLEFKDALGKDVAGNDSTKFEQTEDKEYGAVVYTRKLLPTGKWNALYVPFEIPVSALGDDYDVAYFNNMHAYDKDYDGTIEEMDMEIILIEEGTLRAHHPYFIRAKNKAAENMSLVIFNSKVLSTMNEDHTAIKTSSAYLDFTLTGTYDTMTEENFNAIDGKNYAISTKGSWNRTKGIKPFRLYLNIKERPGSPVKVDEQNARVRMRVVGKEEATAIDEVEMPISIEQSTAIYDLQGRRVLNTEGLKGIYIVNGKKVAF